MPKGGVAPSGLPVKVDEALHSLLRRRDSMLAKEARNEIAFDATAHLNLAKDLLALAASTPELVIIDPALELLEELLQKGSKRGPVLLCMAKAYFYLGKFSDARKFLNELEEGRFGEGNQELKAQIDVFKAELSASRSSNARSAFLAMGALLAGGVALFLLRKRFLGAGAAAKAKAAPAPPPAPAPAPAPLPPPPAPAKEENPFMKFFSRKQ